MSKIVFLDTETTGLDVTRHEVWEIGFIEHRTGYEFDAGMEFQIWPDLASGDPTGLRISRFYEREEMSRDDGSVEPGLMRYTEWSGERAEQRHEWQPVAPRRIAHMLAHTLDGATVVGAVPNFDDGMISKFLRRWGHAPTWHYHLIDIESMAVGYLAHDGIKIDPPYSSDELAGLCGVPPIDERHRHTALGDALWVRAWWGTMRKDAVRRDARTVES